MSAYLVVEIEVTDPIAYEEYRKEAASALATLGGGGKIIIRGGRDGTCYTETAEGGWMPHRFVVVEFPDMKTAKAFYYSEKYQEVLKMRMAASTSKAIFVEGE